MSGGGYMTVKEIAEELKVSRSRAYDIAHECTRLVDGRSIRVSRASFDIWKKLRTCQPLPSSSAAISGGATSALRPARAEGSRTRRAAATTAQPSTCGETWSDDPLDRPIQPRTLHRSTSPSKHDETNVVPLVAQRGR